jgi:hypothetical protein
MFGNRLTQRLAAFVIAAAGLGLAQPALARQMPQCAAGGPGQSYCSYTSNGNECSVTCDTGYYACCSPGDYPTCLCLQ